MTDLGAAAKLRAAFELSPTILAVTGLDDGRLIEVNDAFLRITGFTREEVLGRPIPELGLWVDLGQREAGLAALRAGQPVRNLEARFRTKHGDEIVAIANADIVVVDGRPCVLTALMDITDRVRAQAALQESEQRFAQAFNANPLPMSITSLRDGRHLDVNEAAVQHSGYSREERLGRTKPELGFGVEPEQRDRVLEQLHTEGRVRDFEVVFRTRGGEERFLLVNSEVITYGGQPAVLNVSLDITERKLLERQQEARREEAETLARVPPELPRRHAGPRQNSTPRKPPSSGGDGMRGYVAVTNRGARDPVVPATSRTSISSPCGSGTPGVRPSVSESSRVTPYA